MVSRARRNLSGLEARRCPLKPVLDQLEDPLIHWPLALLSVGAHGRLVWFRAKKVRHIGNDVRLEVARYQPGHELEIGGVDLNVLRSGDRKHRDPDAREVFGGIVSQEL